MIAAAANAHISEENVNLAEPFATKASNAVMSS